MRLNQEMKYTPFYQLPYCCVPATLQWILYRRGYGIFDQIDIGSKLGLRLPKKAKKVIKNELIIYLKSEPKYGYGTQITKKKYSINNFFKRNGISLKISDLVQFKNNDELRKFLKDNLKDDSDIIIRYIKKHNFRDQDFGHFSLITKLYRNDMVEIGDPDLPFFRKISLNNIIDLMSNKYDGVERGLYLVTSR